MALDFRFAEHPLKRLVDPDVFADSVYKRMGEIADAHSCTITVSRSRLYFACDLWLRDTSRILKDRMPILTEELDHFKHSAFVAFWLRRQSPIIQMNRIVHTHSNIKTAQDFFILYGNEVCSFIIAYEICLNYQRNKLKSLFANNQALAARFSHRTFPESIPPKLLVDAAVVLKHKNNSPHSLYLILYSLFSGFEAN